MIPTKGYAAAKAKVPLGPFQFERREVGPHDVQVEILFSGVCHSDIHQARDEWGGAIFPLVPGHEIVGKVTKVGDHVTKFKVGDIAGVGVFVDSCRHCEYCKEGLEQYCNDSPVFTYSSIGKDGNVTYGGYSNTIVVDENYTLHVSEKLPLAGVAPLLCAGITTWSPIANWEMGKGHKVGVVGLGGLGHMAVKFLVSKGAEVTVLSTSPSKKADAERLGAHLFLVTKDPEQMAAAERSLDFIINTVSAQHEYNDYLPLLRVNGTMVLVGIPPDPP
ncbi:MAG TPA: NAD(P)-dependent alcohol dehydrogenase, partial [Mucilaginibacter sp.]|nr:NAD(P)-dependent alcohol dehydrogenase [Mucilaginibacter sp.]